MTRRRAGTADGSGELFPLAPFTKRVAGDPVLVVPQAALHTLHKAELVAEYLRLFVLVTKHGTYLDGFAGPQDPAQLGSWAARLVLEVQPQFLRNFILCEIETDKIAALEALKAEHASRSVHVLPGDFNRVVDRILETGMIDDKEATFCLIDQRTFECEWSTVVKLARHKTTYKIELFYFLAQWWLDRALEATKDEDQLARWWGRSDWTVLRGTKAVERAKLVVERLRLLGYRYVHAWPIYGLEHQSALMYHMIHAADHGEAPKLMARAYKSVVGRDKPVEQGDFFPGH